MEEQLWECTYCGDSDTYDKINARACSHVYPPCVYCGQTPECAQDCGGIAAVLSGNALPH